MTLILFKKLLRDIRPALVVVCVLLFLFSMLWVKITQRVTAEITPQHLYFSAPEAYEKLGSLAQMNPPIRDKGHTEGLWRALDAGVFDVFGSDHAPHTLEEKSQPYPKSPSGMPGVQTILPAAAA